MKNMSKYIIDVSEHNGTLTISQAKPFIAGIIARCSWGWGSDQIDKQWNYNAKQANELQLPLYAYHFCYARNTSEALQEAKLAVSACQGYDVNVIYLDIEYTQFQGDLTPDQYYTIAKTFCDYVEANGYAVGIYANENYFRTKLTNPGFSKWTLWLANYGNNDGYDHWNGTLAYNPFGHVLLHQFTSNAKMGVLKNIKGIPLSGLDCSVDCGLLDTFNNAIDNSITFHVNDKVRVVKNAVWYEGESIASFVYDTVYTIIEIVGDRIVIGIDGKVTGAIHMMDLESV